MERAKTMMLTEKKMRWKIITKRRDYRIPGDREESDSAMSDEARHTQLIYRWSQSGSCCYDCCCKGGLSLPHEEVA